MLVPSGIYGEVGSGHGRAEIPGGIIGRLYLGDVAKATVYEHEGTHEWTNTLH